MAITFQETLVSYALGRRANAEEWNGFSRTFETDAQLGFGVPVSRGTGDRGCIAFSGSDFIGVTEASFVLPHVGDFYERYDTVPVLESGVIGVNVGQGTVAAGEAAGYDDGNGLWGEADSVFTAISGAVFETSGSGIVLLRLRKVA